MSISPITKFIAAGALVFALSGTVSAHGDSGGWWQGWGGGHMMGGGMPGPMMGFGQQEWMLKRIDGRLAFIKTELKITEAQSAAWDGVATTVRETTEAHNGLMRTMMQDMMSGDFLKKPLPDRLAVRQTHLESRLDQIKGLQTAIGKLYAVLNDDQKKVANEIALPMMGMGMGMGRGMGRHMMMHY